MGQLDPERQFCLTWLRQHEYLQGSFGDAEDISKTKGVRIDAMQDKLLLLSPGKARSLRAEAVVLYSHYEERGNTEAASRYNYLVTEWTYIYRAMGSPEQIEADFNSGA